MDRCSLTVLSAGLAMGLAGAAHGAFEVSWDPIDVSALDLGPDNQWTFGEEWDVNAASQTIMLFETWSGEFGSNVMLGSTVTASETRVATAINLDKLVDNNSGFFWNSFQVDLQAGAGASITNVQAITGSQFADVMITDNGGGSFTILWEQGVGSGVGLGDAADLMFSFDIDGVLSFSQVQTPIPAPGAAAFGLAGLAGLRRQRR